MRPFYTPAEMALMLQDAKRLGMRFPKGSESLPISVWCDVANGIGPGAWSRVARQVSTWLQPFARIASVLHDMAYCTPVKDKAHFDRANDDFYFNIQQDIKAKTWRWSPMRIPLYILAEIEYRAVCVGGWDAWCVGETLPQLKDQEE